MSELRCSECGAKARASCDCGAEYVPAIKAAAKAIAKQPHMSNRAIAEKIGVSNQTVMRARTTAPKGAVEKRVGRDGRRRKAPAPPSNVVSLDVQRQRDLINKLHAEAVDFVLDYEKRFKAWRFSVLQIEEGGKDCLRNAFAVCMDQFRQMSHLIDDPNWEDDRACSNV